MLDKLSKLLVKSAVRAVSERECHLWARKQQPHLHKKRELIAPDNSEGGVQRALHPQELTEGRDLSVLVM